MRKRWAVILLMLLLLLVWLIMFFNSRRQLKVSSSACIVPVKNEAPIVEVKPIIVEEKIEAEESVKAPARKAFLEKKIYSGNKGYVIQNKEYVYFGIYSTVIEEVPSK